MKWIKETKTFEIQSRLQSQICLDFFLDLFHLAFITTLLLIPVSSCPPLDLLNRSSLFLFYVFIPQSSLHLSVLLSSFTRPIFYSLTYYHSSCLPSHLPFFSCLNGPFFIPLPFFPPYSRTLCQLCLLIPLFFLQLPILPSLQPNIQLFFSYCGSMAKFFYFYVQYLWLNHL